MRSGARMGHVEMKDHMILDGLWDVYNQQHMGMCAEACAADFKISRAAQDEFALESTNRAIRAQKEGQFKAEIVPVPVPQKKGDPVMVADDEGPKKARPDKSRPSSRSSRRTAPSPPPTPRRSTTAPQRWS
jgi:acetyl-CoA C-acetyltransferase